MEDIVEFMAYEQMEPFGDRRLDILFAQLMSVLAEINRDARQRKRPFSFEDFMPSWSKPQRPALSSVQEGKIMNAWAIVHNARVKRGLVG